MNFVRHFSQLNTPDKRHETEEERSIEGEGEPQRAYAKELSPSIDKYHKYKNLYFGAREETIEDRLEEDEEVKIKEVNSSNISAKRMDLEESDFIVPPSAEKEAPVPPRREKLHERLDLEKKGEMQKQSKKNSARES